MYRGWFIKNVTGILWYSSNKIANRVKTQARRQKNSSRALKWGIVGLCSSLELKNKILKNVKIWKNDRFCTILHLQCYLNYRYIRIYIILKLLILTQEVIVFVKLRKISVLFFLLRVYLKIDPTTPFH